jgi:hypothetical protein
MKPNPLKDREMHEDFELKIMKWDTEEGAFWWVHG